MPAVNWATLLEPVPLGIAAGLFVGKQLGVIGVRRAGNCSWRCRGCPTKSGGLTSTACAPVRGRFTMSLFIGSLAFESLAPGAMVDDRHGIIAGSLLSAVAGYLWLRWTLPAVR